MKKLLMPLLLLVAFSCSDDDDADYGVLIPNDIVVEAKKAFISITTLEADGIAENMIALGKKLYFDKRLSKNNTVSCNSCHGLDTYGVDNVALSTGDTGEFGDRNSPTVIYAFLHSKQFWDGRAETVEEQAGGPILNPVEHAIPDEKYLEDKLRAIQEYQELFKGVYPNQQEPITFSNITHAIGAFERQLHPVSKFDKLLDGDRRWWTQQEVDGLKTFMDNKCNSCHGGIALGGQAFRKFDYIGGNDLGRYSVTENESDKYVFKVPSLRNITKTYPYFHNGSEKDLKEAIRIMGSHQSNVDLSEKEIEDIEAFLNTLTAEVDSKYIEN